MHHSNSTQSREERLNRAAKTIQRYKDGGLNAAKRTIQRFIAADSKLTGMMS